MVKKLPRRVVIFGLIGVINTLTDFVLYLTFLRITDSIVVANVTATSIALVVSFILNAKFTFQVKGLSAARFAAFIGVTLFGLWVLQTGIIYLLSPAVAALPDSLYDLFGPGAKPLRELTPKLLATVVTLVWNYLWYSRVIFKNQS